jgi:hypothetical protein
MSKKRILPAFFLAGTVGFLGLHRLYAGRFITGLVQLVLFVPGAVMLWSYFKGLSAMETSDQVMEWMMNHPTPPIPMLLVSIPGIWAIIDCFVLLAGRFKDGAGNPITKWI